LFPPFAVLLALLLLAPGCGGMAEAGRWDEGRGTSVFQMLLVEGGPLLRVGDHFRDGQAAEPPVLPEHVCEMVTVWQERDAPL
jgi:hypothetical protein